jgi:hypothetical protein
MVTWNLENKMLYNETTMHCFVNRTTSQSFQQLWYLKLPAKIKFAFGWLYGLEICQRKISRKEDGMDQFNVSSMPQMRACMYHIFFLCPHC